MFTATSMVISVALSQAAGPICAPEFPQSQSGKALDPAAAPYPQPFLSAGKTGTAFDIRSYGARGDGVTDDTQAIQAAIDDAARHGGTVLIPPSSGAYLFERIVVKPGVASLIGSGGRLQILRYIESGTIVLAGKKDGFEKNISGLTVNGLIIDANNMACQTIRANSVSNCNITDNTVLNHRLAPACPGGAAISIQALDAGGEDAVGNTIARNVIFSDPEVVPKGAGGRANHGIQLTGQAHYAEGFTSAPAQWRALHSDLTTLYVPKGNDVRDNLIVGGYYGVDVAMGRDNVVAGNRIVDTIRGISLQHSAISNTVSGNEILGTRSAGIHLAYGAMRNRVLNNRIATARSHNGEALLQAYVGSRDNAFEANTGVIEEGGDSQYFAYFGVECSGTTLRGNNFLGSPSKAGVAVESAWSMRPGSPASYAYGKSDAGLDAFTRMPSTDVVIAGNVIAMPRQPGVPAIFVGQASDSNGSHALERVTLSGNFVTHPGRQLEATESAVGQLRAIVLTSNVFYAGPSTEDFVLPRGRSHLVELGSNIPFVGGGLRLAGFPEPSVAVGDLFVAPQDESEHRITYFTGGAENQEITLQLGPRTRVVHDSAKIRCAGMRDVTAQRSGTVRFRLESGIWIETGRNY